MSLVHRLIVGALVVSTAGVARAEDAPTGPGSTEADRWAVAMDDAVAASHVLGGWMKIGAPAMVDRAWAALSVRVRQLVATGERWATAVAGDADGHLIAPDLSILSAEPVKGVESSGFGWRVDPINSSKKFHKGTDYQADRGTPVYAAGDGVVVVAARQRGYGKVIYLDHGGGLVTRYAHLSRIDVARGDTVVGDTVIGAVGSTGRTTGAHLHFEIRIDGRAVNPVQGLAVASLQRGHHGMAAMAGMAWLAALALLPEVQQQAVDAHDPPPGMAGHRRAPRAGRHHRSRPNT